MMRKVLFTWLIAIAILSCCTFLCHMTFSQSLQYHLYDQQETLAYNIVETLNQQDDVSTLAPKNVRLEDSQRCFVVVYDKVHAISFTNATYQENPLTLPLSLVINQKNEPMQSIYTPNETLRFATVSVPYENGHVVVGKSTAMYDIKIAQAQQLLIYLYGFLCMITFPVIWIFYRFGFKE